MWACCDEVMWACCDEVTWAFCALAVNLGGEQINTPLFQDEGDHIGGGTAATLEGATRQHWWGHWPLLESQHRSVLSLAELPAFI